MREATEMVLGRGLELLRANGSRFWINQLIFVDDTKWRTQKRRSVD